MVLEGTWLGGLDPGGGGQVVKNKQCKKNLKRFNYWQSRDASTSDKYDKVIHGDKLNSFATKLSDYHAVATIDRTVSAGDLRGTSRWRGWSRLPG